MICYPRMNSFYMSDCFFSSEIPNPKGSHGDWKTWTMRRVMEHEKLAKSHGIDLSVMEFDQFCPQISLNLYLFGRC